MTAFNSTWDKVKPYPKQFAFGIPNYCPEGFFSDNILLNWVQGNLGIPYILAKHIIGIFAEFIQFEKENSRDGF